MKTRELLIAVCTVVVCARSSGAVGTWRNFTSMKEDVRSLAREGETFWAATSGGLFGWNSTNDSYQLFTNADGLQSTDLTAVGVDNQGNIWTGTATGLIHVYSQQNKTWRYIPDIANTNQTDKRINSFSILGDTVFVCTNFGVSVFRIRRFEFGDTYSRFGSLQGNARVSVSSAAVFNDSLWLSVSDNQNINRVAVASLATSNLLPPEAWTLRTVGSTAVVPKQLAVFNNSLWSGTNTGLYRYVAGDWSVLAPISGQNIIGLGSSSNLMSVATSNLAYTIDQQDNVVQVGGALPYPATCLVSDATGSPVVGTKQGGILRFGTSWTSHGPNGPNSNSFVSVAVNNDGSVWGASGTANGRGVYRYNGKDWKSFTSENSGLPTNNYYRVSTGCDGTVWASSWGQGVFKVSPGADSVDASNIFGRNVGMIGIPNDTNFVVVTTVVCDANRNSWMSINTASNARILAVQESNSTWTMLPIKVGSLRLNTLISNLTIDRSFAVDANNTLWAVASRANQSGVFSLGNKGAIDDSVEVFLSASDGLPSNEVTTIVADHDNNLWVGTDKGICIILDPIRPKRSGGIASYVPLRGTVINSIAVDALNQKWVATPDGVSLLSPDGTQQIAFYTVASTNGGLIANDVKSIAIDNNTGTVYFGTQSGLASLTTAAAAPLQTFDKLRISPNPFVIPSSSEATIDGLVENSTLKVLSIDGRLVRQVRTPGGRIGFWDGKDEDGSLVSSGVYIIVASSEKDEAVAKGKIAVIRR